MRRKIGYTVGTVFVVLALLLPLAVSAQGELTLESLAEQFAGLISRVIAVEERLQALDQLDQRIAALENPPEKTVVQVTGESCEIIQQSGMLDTTMHTQTAIDFLETFDENPEFPRIFGVLFYPESNAIEAKFMISLDDRDHYVMASEIWQGCEYSGVDFYFVNIRGERIQNP